MDYELRRGQKWPCLFIFDKRRNCFYLKKRGLMNKVVALMVTFLFLIGCASSTIIKSNPPGAKLYLDGQYQGETPHPYSDRAIAGTWRTVKLRKEGYKDFTGNIKREKLSVPALIGGIFLTVPFLWVLEYPHEYTFEMDKLPE
ncbi:MAG: hypothetical protein AMK69_23940 [Nitrospira bacterium SG8_3]|nr:MAG: hypothetical protein AMK69_23940 [Nitrospira bacterium SG8_3]